MPAEKKLTLSIVIPVYNEQDYLVACLDAIAGQTETPESVFVVDNGSTDRTLELAQRYAFVTILRESKRGIVFGRNRGFDAVKSDIIARIDADTRLTPDWSQQVRRYFSEKTDISAVTGNCTFYDYPLKRTTRFLHTLVYFRIQHLVSGHTVLWGANMALRKSAWLAVRQQCDQHNRGHEDIDLAFALHDAGLKIRRSKNLRAEVSMLRGNLKLTKLRGYLAGWHEAYEIKGHPYRAWLIRLPEWLTFAAAVITKPFLRPRKASKVNR